MKIIKVEIVEGKVLNPRWNNKMQKIYVENHSDFYIDKLPIHNGTDWSLFINQELSNYYITQYNVTALNRVLDWLHLNQNITTPPNTISLERISYPANFRADDGHFVRSRAEVIIDNYLYHHNLVHAYERKLPIEDVVFSDFYIPKNDIYIEFWGMENDQTYEERKKKKIEIYKTNQFKLIELYNKDADNIDDSLPAKLLKFGIKI